MARPRQFKGADQKLRARWHDYNSQRRYRNQSTLTWLAYKTRTQQGTKRLGAKPSK